MLAQPGLGASVLERLSDWPRAARIAPESLIVRCTSSFVEIRANNVLPVGIFSFLFGLWMLPALTAGMIGLWHLQLQPDPQRNLWIAMVGWFGVLLALALIAFLIFGIYFLDAKGGAGENLTLLDRKHRKVYVRLPKGLSKGEWNWDDLHAYIDRRNAISRVNQVLVLVELDPPMQRAQSLVQVQVGGLHKEPLAETYAFIKKFMDHGVSELPPLRLTARPEPAWYTSMPPWLLWLPRPVAKSAWAFVFLLFTWQVVVWARLLSRVSPYSRWPADFEARLKADEGQGTPEEQAWLAKHLQPPEPLPWTARLAFAAAVLVSGPVWWTLARSYVASLAKLAGV